MVGIRVGFHEHRRDADGDGGARDHRREGAVAARTRALPAGLLHGMGRVHHDGIAGLGHDRQAAHIGDQRIVAEGHAALGH